MKTTIITLITIVFVWLFSACGGGHSAEDGHDHAAENKKAATEDTPGEHDHAAEVSNIASLTAAQIAAVDIKLGAVENKNLTATLRVNGMLRVPNNNKANVTSLYGGVVKSLHVQLGDQVRKGQVIARVTNPEFVQIQEEYLTLASRIALAEQELQRQQQLNEGNAGTMKNLQAARAALNTLRTRRASLQQQIKMMGINPASITDDKMQADLLVTSPISGVVSDVFAKIGSYVDVSSPVIEVVDNGLIHLDLQVFEKDLPHVKIGQVVNFTLTNNPQISYAANVVTVGASFENDSKSVAVHCTVIGNKTGLIDGMNTIAAVGLNDVLVAAVRNEAIVEADGKFYIFIQSEKEGEEHHDEVGHEHSNEERHDHQHDEKNMQRETTFNFERVEVNKGISEMGYTAITPVAKLPTGVKVVTQGAFFIQAKMSNNSGHSHSH